MFGRQFYNFDLCSRGGALHPGPLLLLLFLLSFLLLLLFLFTMLVVILRIRVLTGLSHMIVGAFTRTAAFITIVIPERGEAHLHL